LSSLLLLTALSTSTLARMANGAKVANYSTGKIGTKDYENLSLWVENGKSSSITYRYGARAYDKPEIKLQSEGPDTFKGQACFKVKFPNGLLPYVIPTGQRLKLVDEAGKYSKLFRWKYEGPINGRGTFCTPCVEEEEAPAFVRKYFLQHPKGN
jgi:hypothetical protein